MDGKLCKYEKRNKLSLWEFTFSIHRSFLMKTCKFDVERFTYLNAQVCTVDLKIQLVFRIISD